MPPSPDGPTPANPPGPGRRLSLLPLIGAAFFATALYVGARGFVRDLLITIWGPRPLVTAELKMRAAQIRRRLAPGEGLLYVTSQPEIWYSRMWQRILYPVPVFLVQGRKELSSPRVRELRARYRIHHALSAGRPPLDPGWRRRSSFAGPAGSGSILSFGELAP